jgi:LCP family protein required for cell wall assembly
MAVGGSAYAYSVYHSMKTAVKTMHQPIQRVKSEKRVDEIVLEQQDPFSVLLLGVDERAGDKGRSDTIIVLGVNPNTNSIKMISIPRDTRTELIGRGTKDKINHAYAYGGIEMSMNTVENFLDIPIDYFIQINMEGFKDIVDSVGGVTVANDFAFSYEGHNFPKGELSLNGEEALAFSRMRYEDPRGDFGRQLRQRMIIQGIIKNGASLSSLGNYKEIFTALGKNVKTNLTFDEMVDIQSNYKDAASNVTQIDIEGTGDKIDETYYLLVDEKERVRVQNEMKEQLGLMAPEAGV